MTLLYGGRSRMLSEGEDDSTVTCRERRRRRIEMRRLVTVSGGADSSSPETPNPKENSTESWEGKRVRTGETTSSSDDVEAPPDASNLTDVTDTMPVYGTMSVAGRTREMEDAISVRSNLCRPEINRRRPVDFFGVFDGHGGPHVAALCRERMHVLLEEELMRVKGTGEAESAEGQVLGIAAEWWRAAIRNCFERMDEVALSSCHCGSHGTVDCRCHPLDMALVGSTAVVALLTPDHIFVANCGDSRAVLCRAGRAVLVSTDQKPDREDERARIEASGGRIVFANGTARVEGILAMSRAIGDKFLKPTVTSEPEISITKRKPEDECLILASDGLWDVVSSELACQIAHECLQEDPSTAAAGTTELNPGPWIGDEVAGALYPSRSASAAALLTRLALGRKSADNISVIVVDLRMS